MNELVLFTGNTLPTLIDAAGDQARMRFLEFFTANIRNPNTRRSYAKAAEEFLAWCSFAGVPSIAAVQPVHVGTWCSVPSSTAVQSHAIRGKGHWNFNEIGRSIIMSPHRRRLELHGLAKSKNVTPPKEELTDLFMNSP